MPFQRSSGILLHPTSFPSRFGIGDLGKAAYEFIDFLAACGQKLWQILPLGPTGYGNSPYMSFSAIAGNPLLICPDLLVEAGLLTHNDLSETFQIFPTDTVDFERAIPYKMNLLRVAYENFKENSKRSPNQESRKDFQKFVKAEAKWLNDYAFFMAMSDTDPEKTWNQWEPAIAKRDPKAIAAKTQVLQDGIQFHQFLQFIFFQQWSKLKAYANEKEIQIIGDIPIYVAHNSADVWANPQDFMLDPETFEPALMAGVPPDYFSETGQLWGNPVYNWEYLEKHKFAWWIDRFRFMLHYVDLIRIDHFRGFEAFWQVPAGEETAINGEWQTAPGVALFETIRDKLGSLPILAEDLGVITPEVEELRDMFEFPGMRVLLFAFGGDSGNIHLPHHFVRNSLVYTGTHDNDTTVGWWQRIDEDEKKLLVRYLGYDSVDDIKEINWLLIRLALSSVANQAIVPLQDILGLDNSARMNTPGTIENNWRWRYSSSEILQNKDLQERLLSLTQLYSR
jgi:4-alpha-glucanotransferase